LKTKGRLGSQHVPGAAGQGGVPPTQPLRLLLLRKRELLLLLVVVPAAGAEEGAGGRGRDRGEAKSRGDCLRRREGR